MAGAYSVVYKKSGSPDTHAVDWDFIAKRQWARSWAEYLDETWITPREAPSLLQLTEEARMVILRHFGLEKWEKEFPLENICSLSPKELCSRRRIKELILQLPKIEIISDTVNSRLPAEEFN